ncbi:MAG: recombinase family protein [Sphingopyxis sp.]|nr:recombinase family protein [Sphingopyxis sp.]
MRDGKPVRCAIYTRKSTEEGLEQAFNSLDAQREACSAYIASQRHEGWVLVPDLYDDGGYSGGNIDRPGLQHLLADVRAGKIDVIVVYKVDRLTRSLADFARIVDVLDQQGASFVSITQAFNTTTSMGRLTLNVLLSFAQFEREVTGERIRDKIAASKARGMWMGGNVPLGYQVQDRKLVIVPDDAAKLQMIYEQYLALGSVRALAGQLDTQGVRSKVRVSRTGKTYGGAALSRGALYLMLKNRTYLGEVNFKGKSYPGEHVAIIEPELFAAVQALLAQNRNNNADGVGLKDPSLLVGKVWDYLGRRMSPSHTSRRTKRYRYYASATEIGQSKAVRVPAGDLEAIVIAQLCRLFDEDDAPIQLLSLSTGDGLEQRTAIARYVERVDVCADRINITFSADIPIAARSTSIPAALVSRGREKRIAVPPDQQRTAQRDPALIKLVVKAHMAREALSLAGERSVAEVASARGYTKDYFGVLVRIGYLAPDIVTAILDGRQPAHLNRQRLARVTNLPIEWQRQREMFGFG